MKFLLLLSFFIWGMSEDEVYNKILTDKFFRGIVADNIIENKKYLDVVNGDFYTYSQLRYAVMLWIEENPHEAAKRFSEIVSSKGSYDIQFKVYEYRINPKFKELIDKLEEAAKRDDMSIEERRIFSSLIFEGAARSQGYTVNIDNAKNSNSYQTFKDRILNYNYVNLNNNLLKEVLNDVDFIYKYLKVFNVKDIAEIIKRCDEKYLEFQKLVSSIKGLEKISEKDGEKLKELFSEIKNLLVLKFLVIKYRNIENKKNIVDKRYDEILNSIEKELEKLSNDTNVLAKFEKIYNVMNQIDLEFDFFNRINYYLKELENKKYSCFLDYLIRKTDFTSKYKKINEKKKEIILYLSTFSKTNPSNMNDLEISIFQEKIKEAQSIIDFENSVMLKHRKIQFIFFDNILPFEFFYTDAKKLKLKIKTDYISVK